MKMPLSGKQWPKPPVLEFCRNTQVFALWKIGINQKMSLLHNLLTPSSHKGYIVKFFKVQPLKRTE